MAFQYFGNQIGCLGLQKETLSLNFGMLLLCMVMWLSMIPELELRIFNQQGSQ